MKDAAARLNKDFQQSQSEKAGLLEPLRKTDLMEPFRQDKPDVKLRALRWVVVRDIVVAYRFPIVALLAAFGLTALEPAVAKRMFRAIVVQEFGQKASISEAPSRMPTISDDGHADKSRHASEN